MARFVLYVAQQRFSPAVYRPERGYVIYLLWKSFLKRWNHKTECALLWLGIWVDEGRRLQEVLYAEAPAYKWYRGVALLATHLVSIIVVEVYFSKTDAIADDVLNLCFSFFFSILICCFLVVCLPDFVLKFQHRFKLVHFCLCYFFLLLLTIVRRLIYDWKDHARARVGNLVRDGRLAKFIYGGISHFFHWWLYFAGKHWVNVSIFSCKALVFRLGEGHTCWLNQATFLVLVWGFSGWALGITCCLNLWKVRVKSANRVARWILAFWSVWRRVRTIRASSLVFLSTGVNTLRVRWGDAVEFLRVRIY